MSVAGTMALQGKDFFEEGKKYVINAMA